jgi:hypothetical protein
MIVHLDVIQGTETWFELRNGLLTASRFSDLVTSKGERSKSREGLLYQLAGERVTGRKEETYQSAAMSRGIEMEAKSRQAFELITGLEVQQVGLILTDDRKCGCSPDGLVGDDSGFETKCPMIKTHVKYLLDNKLPAEYYQQVHGSMYVTGRPFWWFMSYYPGMKPLILRVEKDGEWCKKFSDEIDMFSHDLEELIKKIR